MMSEMSDENILIQLTLFAEASPAPTCPLPDAARDWLESTADFGMSSIAFLRSLALSGALSKMSPVCYPAAADGTLPSSFEGWSNAGMASAGGFLTLDISESPNAAAESSLWGVLETDVHPKYFLSARAARGILSRARKRGKIIPPALRAHLLQVAQEAPDPLDRATS
jgi:hypothetical protein